MVNTVLFSAAITNVNVIYNILKCLTYQEFAIVRPLEEGLKITIEDMKCCETSVYIPEGVFSAYHLNTQEEIKFKISLKVFAECLYIFGDEGTPTLKMTYKAAGSPLLLVIKHSEENIVVDCQLHTIEVDDFQEMILSDDCKENSIAFDGKQFVHILSNLNVNSDDFEIEIIKNPDLFRLKTTSILGESTMDIKRISSMITTFQNKSDFKAKYAFNNLRQILKILLKANKVYLSTGDSGLLAFQLILNTDEKQMFVEHFIAAMCDD